MRIAILGTRGIPNHYGGYEEYAEFLALGFAQRGHEVIVYNAHNHANQKSKWNEIQIIHVEDLEYKWGAIGRFLYNLKCIRDVKTRNCDVLLQLDYTTISVWGWLLPKAPIIVTAMDSLRNKRTHHGIIMGIFLSYAERLAIRYTDYLITDSQKVKLQLKEKFGQDALHVSYGAKLFNEPNESLLKDFNVVAGEYDLLIGRFIVENNIEKILDGVVMANVKRPFLVIGNHVNDYSLFVKNKYRKHPQIRFLGNIYDLKVLDNLRYFSNLCFHGNTTSSANPQLLQAMASSSLIVAKENELNRVILGEDGLYFNRPVDVAYLLKTVAKSAPKYQAYLENNLKKIKEIYNWDKIIDQYESDFAGKIHKVLKIA